MNEDDLEFYEGIIIILNNLIQERTKLISLLQTIDEECSFPLNEDALRLRAIEELKIEGKIPPFFEEL